MDNQPLPYSTGQPPAPGGAPVAGMPGAAGPPPVPHHHLLQQQQAQLQAFWAYQRQEAERASASDFKNHQLPLARIKKIMKADEDVRMISAEAPVLFAKACELFILELTIRSWLHAEENKRRTLQRNDVAAAIARTDVFDFLVDIVPREEAKEEPGSALGFAAPGTGASRRDALLLSADGAAGADDAGLACSGLGPGLAARGSGCRSERQLQRGRTRVWSRPWRRR